MRAVAIIILVFSFFLVKNTKAQSQGMPIPPFSVEIASKFANEALVCISNEYPNKLSHIVLSGSDIVSPQKLHPAFYGCYTWSSSVHAHWLLVKMLKMFPNIPEKDAIIKALDKNLTLENIQAEVKYLKHDSRLTFERPYGWAWLLKLSAELAISKTDYAQRWFKNLQPLTDVIEGLYYEYLPGLYYPIRRGVHENTAFGIALALDYAIAVEDKTFENFLKERAKFYFLNDNKIPASWEPEGDDFLSPSLVEADLMRRVLDKNDFIQWFKNFMPEIPFSLKHPVVVANRKDEKGVQLDGLNLSRAWCMFELAKIVPDDSQTHRDLWQSGYRHAAEALPNVLSENSKGSHWLSTFAGYMYVSLSDIEQ